MLCVVCCVLFVVYPLSSIVYRLFFVCGLLLLPCVLFVACCPLFAFCHVLSLVFLIFVLLFFSSLLFACGFSCVCLFLLVLPCLLAFAFVSARVCLLFAFVVLALFC